MKRGYLILAFLIFLIPVYAGEESVELNIGESKLVSGKNFTITGINSERELKVIVDGIGDIINLGSSKDVNGMIIKYIDVVIFDQEDIQASLTLSVAFECGDNICNRTETSASCCIDCGCDSGFACVNNICFQRSCRLSSECEDNNPCTMNICNQLGQCIVEEINSCVDNDGCCLDSCNYENDNDCDLVECLTDDECLDEDPCTIDSCSNNSCLNELKEGCGFNNTCEPYGTIRDDLRCTLLGWVENEEEKTGFELPLILITSTTFIIILIGLIFLKIKNKKLRNRD